MKEALEKVRKILVGFGIEPSEKDEANVVALCDIFNLQTRGTPRDDYENRTIAGALREITREGYSINFISRKHKLEEGGEDLLYEMKATELQSKESMLEEKQAPRVIGIAVREPEPQTPPELANALLDVHFANAINAILVAIHTPRHTVPDEEE